MTTHKAETDSSRGAAVVIAALWLSAVLTALYWIVFFTSGALKTSETECYIAFESAFPAADAWLAAACVLCAEGLRRRRAWAALWGIAAGSAFIYLGCMDGLYDLEQGMTRDSQGPIIAEIAIILWSLAFGPFLMRYSWQLARLPS